MVRSLTTGQAVLTPPETLTETRDTSAINRKWLDMPYANASAAQKLDIYLPHGGVGPFPVVMSIHGGGFAFGDKTGIELKSALVGLSRGYAVVSINYRLSGEAHFPAQIHDVKAAIRFIRAQAHQYHLNGAKIGLWGSSAGGTLAALAGTSGGVDALQDPALGHAAQSDRVQAVVDWFGPINFLTMDDQFKVSGLNGELHNTADSFESRLMGQPITLIPDLVRRANPETYISPEAPPFFIQHGPADNTIPAQQSQEFAAKLAAVLGQANVTLELIEGAEHCDAQFSTPKNITKVLDFLDKHLK